MLEESITTAELEAEEVEAEEVEARFSLRRWIRRAGYTAGAFVPCCLAVVPFLAGHSLHRSWESLGKFFVLLAMALLIPTVVCVGIAINTWWYARSLRAYFG